MNPFDPNDRLSATLSSWRVTPPRDPNFRPAVFDRIRQNARNTWSAYVRSHLVGWSAVALVAIAAAGWSGHSIAQGRIEDSREQMVVSYLGNLDPRVMAKLELSR
jgi:hypothetical protein